MDNNTDNPLDCPMCGKLSPERVAQIERAADILQAVRRDALVAALNTFDAPERIYVRELVDGEWTHSLAELPGDKAVAHTIRLLRRVLLGGDYVRE